MQQQLLLRSDRQQLVTVAGLAPDSAVHPMPQVSLSCMHMLLCLSAAGYDYINRDEVTSADFFVKNGYDTAHFGKWHNGRTLGYEPWEMGFEDSWLPSSHVHLDNLMRWAGLLLGQQQQQGHSQQQLMHQHLKQFVHLARAVSALHSCHVATNVQ